MALVLSHPARPVRVLLDARKFNDGGIGTYLRNIIEEIAERGRGSGVKVTLLTNPGVLPPHITLRLPVIQVKAKPFSIRELLFLGRKIRWSDFDLFHTPNYPLPLGVKVPSIVTIHDVIHLSHPEKWYYPAIAGRLIRSSLKRASRVLTVSESSRRALLERFPNEQKDLPFAVIPNAVDPRWFWVGVRSGSVQERFGINGQFLLTVLSSSKPHKGVSLLMEAFNSLRTNEQYKNMNLVVVGRGSKAKALQGVEGVRALGEVTEEELVQLYGSASLLVIPSLAEGFCLPALEAKALGTPVVTTPLPSVQEILGGGDSIALDFSPQELAASIASALKGGYRTSPAEAARIHEVYGRETVVDQLIGFYQETAGISKPAPEKVEEQPDIAVAN